MAKKIKDKIKKKGIFNSGLFKLVALAVVVGCCFLIVTTNRDCAEKERELVSIQVKIDAYEADNADLQNVLESDDLSAYMERIAIEERGYAYPDERRFYDVSRD